jgi:DNA-directed RNA polymerase subunit RPC12/RpoP
MPIKQSTRQALENHIDQYPGFNLIDSTENNDSGKWTLECLTCTAEFKSKIFSLKNSLYNGKPIVCPKCKLNTKIEKFEEANDLKHVFY